MTYLETFRTYLDLSREDVETATEDPAARDLTDEDMQHLASKVGLSIVGGMSWWEAIRVEYNGMTTKEAT